VTAPLSVQLRRYRGEERPEISTASGGSNKERLEGRAGWM
jgi:hypothetical protein